jgi:hypothetical protein
MGSSIDGVVVLRLVDEVDDRGEGRRLARPRRPRHQHEAALDLGEPLQLLREAELLDRHDLRGNDAEDGARAALLPEQVHPEAREAQDLVGEVRVALRAVLVPQGGGDDRPHELDEVGLGDRPVPDRLHAAADAEHRRPADGEVEVGCAPPGHQPQEAFDLRRGEGHGRAHDVFLSGAAAPRWASKSSFLVAAR